MNRLASIEVRECRVPLPRPLHLGNFVIKDRDYTIVRVRDEGGAEGTAWGYSRGADVASTIRRSLAPLVSGLAFESAVETWKLLYDSSPHINQGGLFLRALSLVDIALWDLQCSRERTSLGRLLNGRANAGPVTAACCYPSRGKDPGEDALEARELVTAGYRSLKVCAADGGQRDTARLRSIREAVGPEVELKIDLHWLWSSAEDARPCLPEWEGLGVAWVEDAFLPEALTELKKLKELARIPVAYGDEQNGRFFMRHLISSGSIDVIRLDATVVGGVTEFLRLAREANAAGLRVSAHLFEEYHAPLLGALEDATNVERFAPQSGLDGIDELRRLSPEGSVWDWEAVTRYAR